MATTNMAELARVVDPVEVKRELVRRRALESFRSFVSAFPPAPNYLWPRHAVGLCGVLQEATNAVEAGACAYACVCIPQRHGKSDIASRRWPLWHRIRNPEHDVIMASYNYQMASELSWDARSLAEQVASMYGLELARGRSALASWRWQGHRGALHATGIGGTIVGRGAHVLVIDDYFKNREEAESEVIRDKTWHSLQSDLLTRLAPAHAVVVVAQRWHEDDIVGRIIARNTPGHPSYDKDFPKFRIVRYPAWDPVQGWLFTERYPVSWYEAQRAFMGSYAWAAQAMQDPAPREGRLLRADLVQYVDPADWPWDKVTWRRGWDLARTRKQRTKDDPDFTVGTKAGVLREGRTDSVWVADVRRGRWGTLDRDRRIRSTAEEDGNLVNVRVEVGPDSKDAVQYVRNAVGSLAIVRAVLPVGDKVVRAQRLESTFEGGRVYVMRAPWNDAWVSEFLSFPGGRHDDQVDSLVVAVGKDLSARASSGAVVL